MGASSFLPLCRVIKEYEREARVDGVPQSEILATKQKYVAQVNAYVGRKKEADRGLQAQQAAQAAAMPVGSPDSGAANPFAVATSPQQQKQKQIRGALVSICWTANCAIDACFDASCFSVCTSKRDCIHSGCCQVIRWCTVGHCRRNTHCTHSRACVTCADTVHIPAPVRRAIVHAHLGEPTTRTISPKVRADLQT